MSRAGKPTGIHRLPPPNLPEGSRAVTTGPLLVVGYFCFVLFFSFFFLSYLSLFHLSSTAEDRWYTAVCIRRVSLVPRCGGGGRVVTVNRVRVSRGRRARVQGQNTGVFVIKLCAAGACVRRLLLLSSGRRRGGGASYVG